ncbi:MAG: hypothetical protein PHI65_03590 [Firmicutes bacterium]|nr:hypothetical protein [Bacillota bacterium]
MTDLAKYERITVMIIIIKKGLSFLTIIIIKPKIVIVVLSGLLKL